MKSPQGFTRTELFIVVSTVIILAALLVPVITRKLGDGQRQQCLNNLQKIGVGLLQYAHDHDNRLVRSWSGRNNQASDSTSRYKWMDAVFPYVKSEEIFTCSSHDFKAIGGLYKYRGGDHYGSYAINATYWGTGNQEKSPAGENNLRLSNETLVHKNTSGAYPAFTIADDNR